MTKSTPKKKIVNRQLDLFLGILAAYGNVKEACEKAGIARQTVYQRREKDSDFAAAWDNALEIAADVLEREAWRRAVEGWDEPVYQGKELVGTIRKYDSTLLIFLLKGIRPAKYRERHELSGPGGGAIPIKSETQLTPEESGVLHGILSKL